MDRLLGKIILISGTMICWLPAKKYILPPPACSLASQLCLPPTLTLPHRHITR